MEQFMSSIKSIFNKIKSFFLFCYRKVDFALSFVAKRFFKIFKRVDVWIYLSIITFIAIQLRVSTFPIMSQDFNGFLKHWYKDFYDNGFINGLGKSIGDYTPAYVYFIGFLSLFRIEPDSLALLSAIKWISVFFDVLMAFYAFQIAKLFSKENKSISVIVFGVVLLAPTIFLNSAVWGQCDVIYTCFAVMSFYYLLKGKPTLSMILFGVSFSFKLQALFLLPVFIIVALRQQIKIRKFLWIPLMYVIIALPSVFCGRPFMEIMKIYFNQGKSYQYLSVNGSNFYMFINNSFASDNKTKYLVDMALYLCLGINGSLLFYFYKSKLKMNKEMIIKLGFLFALTMPYFMPMIHDRYFYVADVFAILYLIVNPKKIHIAVFATMGSLASYSRYLFGVSWMDTSNSNVTFRIGSVLILIAIVLLLKDILSSEKELPLSLVDDVKPS